MASGGDSSKSYSPPSCTVSLPGKKGACFCLREPGQKGCWTENVPRIVALNVYWNYSWGSERIAEQPPNVTFLPMIWGGGKKISERLQKHVVESSSAPPLLLGFNEPDRVKQSNLSVERALALWPQLEATGLPLVSPSTGQPPSGSWLKEFMAAKPRVDCVGVHWYEGPQVKQFQRQMEKWHEQYDRPILITEFAVADWGAKKVEDNRYSAQQVLEFMEKVVPWLESTPWVVGYSWFPFLPCSAAGTCSALFDEKGNLTQLGECYASIR